MEQRASDCGDVRDHPHTVRATLAKWLCQLITGGRACNTAFLGFA